MTYLGKSLSENEREDSCLFGWILEGLNRELMQEVWDFFENEIKKIRKVQLFKSICSSETEGFFEKLFIRGENFSENELNILKNHLESHKNIGSFNQKIEIEKFISDISSLKK